jgi:hypothetical protein
MDLVLRRLRTVGSTPTRFRQIFPLFKGLADRGEAKGSNKGFGSGFSGRFTAARTVAGFLNLDVRKSRGGNSYWNLVIRISRPHFKSSSAEPFDDAPTHL